MNVLGGTIAHDDVNEVFVATDVSNGNKGVLKSEQGGNIKTELRGVANATVTNNNQGTLEMIISDKDVSVLNYYDIDSKGDTLAWYQAKFDAGSHLFMNGPTINSFHEVKETYGENYCFYHCMYLYLFDYLKSLY